MTSKEHFEDAGRRIMAQMLAEDCGCVPGEEREEAATAHNILQALARLQSCIGDVTPEQQRELTAIRAAASSLLRLHASAPQ